MKGKITKQRQLDRGGREPRGEKRGQHRDGPKYSKKKDKDPLGRPLVFFFGRGTPWRKVRGHIRRIRRRDRGRI